ncbi:MAG: hypothetical protein ACFCBV_05055 [Phycisphaerales bacterium]
MSFPDAGPRSFVATIAGVLKLPSGAPDTTGTGGSSGTASMAEPGHNGGASRRPASRT